MISLTFLILIICVIPIFWISLAGIFNFAKLFQETAYGLIDIHYCVCVSYFIDSAISFIISFLYYCLICYNFFLVFALVYNMHLELISLLSNKIMPLCVQSQTLKLSFHMLCFYMLIYYKSHDILLFLRCQLPFEEIKNFEKYYF